jgi:hypothetical protein
MDLNIMGFEVIDHKTRKATLSKAVAIAVLCAASTQVSALPFNIQFDYSYDTNNFFDTQAKRDVLSAAGNYFNGIIEDDLMAITSVGSNQFDAVFTNPGDGTSATLNGYNVAENTIVIYAGGRGLSGSTLGVGGAGGFGVSGFSDFVTNAITRGETATTAGVSGTTAVDIAPWGGSISFNTSSSWYFDSDLTTDGDIVGNDFYSVALHEIGHVMGIGIADSWDNLVSGNVFTGAASNAANGGDVLLNSSLSHWANGTGSFVDGLVQEAAMDPSLNTGTRKFFTDLDKAGLTDIGWQVSAVPVPAAVWLFASGLMGLIAVGRRRA